MSNNDIIRSLHRSCRPRRTLGLAFVTALALAASSCGGESAVDEGRSGDEGRPGDEQEQTETSEPRDDGAPEEAAETANEALPVDDGAPADGGAPVEVIVGDPSSGGSVELPDGLAGFVPVPAEWIVTNSSVIEDESSDIVYIGFDIGGTAEDAAEKLREAMLADGFVEESFIGTQDSESFNVLASWDRDGRNVFVTIGDDVERPGTAIGAVTVAPSI